MAAIQEEEEGALDPFLSCMSRKQRGSALGERAWEGLGRGGERVCGQLATWGAILLGFGRSIGSVWWPPVPFLFCTAGGQGLPFWAGRSIALVGSRPPTRRV